MVTINYSNLKKWSLKFLNVKRLPYFFYPFFYFCFVCLCVNLRFLFTMYTAAICRGFSMCGRLGCLT